MPTPSGTLPTSLRVAIGVSGLLGVSALVFGLYEASQTRLSRLEVGGGTAIVMLAYGAGLLASAWGLSRASRWARGPAVAMALVLLPVAWSFITPGPGQAAPPGLVAVGVVLGVLALVLVVSLVTPASTRALIGTDARQKTDDPTTGRDR